MYKKVALWILMSMGMALAISLTACEDNADQSFATTHISPTKMSDQETATLVASEGTPIFEAAPNNLQPCGTFETMRLLEAPEPATLAPTASILTSTPQLTTSTPNPAPAEDRVGFPENYANDFKLLFVFDRPDRRLARAICGNELAVQRRAGEPFPYGSVLLMISYSAKLDSQGQPMLDEHGHYVREKFVAYHVMRKEKGFGEAYRNDRAGEWEFVGYQTDGVSYETRPENSTTCAACHKADAGEAQDYVFRMNLVNGGEAEVASPPASDHQISIYLYSFRMSPLTIKAGTTVTWINNDQAKHTIMSAILDDQGKFTTDPNALFASDVLPSVNIEPGASFSFTFDKPGEYYYICTLHKNMAGKIIVTN